MNVKRLYRSRTDLMLGGVCGGLAKYLNIDPAIVRLVFLLLLFLGGGGFWIYLVLWIITPVEPLPEAGSVIEINPKKDASAVSEQERSKDQTKK
jgi:phage shock protein C